ncbi:MAG TPA: glycosyltransferase family 39 protein [Abditibacteriaceae bacterium]|jgi:4-amino-4-deoxy-L-arabinose transferase-like glycosyltransferase
MINTDSPDGSNAGSARFRKRLIAVIAILIVALPLFLGGWAFLDPDEGRYGTIPYEMLANADFVTPTQNDIKFFDKPPLLYWTIAASYSLFGYQEWAARLIPALAALAGILMVYALGKRMFGPRAGLLGAVILGTSLMWPIMAHIVVTDMLVSSLVFIAMALWWMGHCEPNTRSQTRYFIGFWIVLALSVLTKGPITLVLTGGCVFMYAMLCRQWQSLSAMRWRFGFPLFCAIAVPWYILVAQRNPEFNHYFWYDQHIARFMGKSTNNSHVEGVGYYFKLLPLVLFPWSAFIPAMIFANRHKWRDFVENRFGESQRAVIYALCGIGVTLGFFSASSGKLLTYILPVVPLCALLMGAYFDRVLSGRIAWGRALSVSVAIVAALLVIAGIAILVVAPTKLRSLGINENIAVTLGIIVGGWGIATAISTWRFRATGLIASTAGGFTVLFVAILLILPSVMPRFTTESLVQYVRPGFINNPESEILTLGYVRSIPFYSKRRVEILGPPGELENGVEHMALGEKEKWVFSGSEEMRDLREEMTDLNPVYCFMQASRRRRADVDLLMREIGNGAAPIVANERFLVFGNPAALKATPPKAGLYF